MEVESLQIRNMLAETSRRLAAFSGEAVSLETRKQKIMNEVGLAKGRLAQKAKVDLFLEELQAEAHARRVGDFEKLLTALVLEVLPGEKPIGLELEIERGQPSLDIVSRIAADWSEDIYEDQGGALTNIVVLGLRMIAVVRSGMRKFLVLDESDCWVKGDRVPSFYGVVKDAARKIGVQCFVISHHDIASFQEGFNVARLHGNPEMSSGVSVENNPRPYVWSDDEDGIRWIRLRNFQGYVDQTVRLTPGVNALTGDNNIGKSSFVRALRAVFYGETRDRLIRRGENRCEVEIGLPGGRVLHWDRQHRRNPVNVWKLLDKNGAVVTENGMTYETGGRTAPDWVKEVVGIGPVEGLDVHITKQKTPVFLLDKPGSTRAAVLSIGQESGHVRKMISLHREQCAADAARVKEGETEMGVLLSRLEALSELEGMQEDLQKARGLADEIERLGKESSLLSETAKSIGNAISVHTQARKSAEALCALPDAAVLRGIEQSIARAKASVDSLSGISDAKGRVLHNRTVLSTLAGLPDRLPALVDTFERENVAEAMCRAASSLDSGKAVAAALGELPCAMPTISRSDEAIKAGKGVKDAKLAFAHALEAKKLFGQLPDAMPLLTGSMDLSGAADGLSSSEGRLAQAATSATQADTAMHACEAELASLVEDMGHACPLCNHEIDDPHVFLTGHAHGPEAAHA